MPRKTREQVWRELDEMGEEMVRARMSEGGKESPRLKLVREWLARREKVSGELRATSDRVEGEQLAVPSVRRRGGPNEPPRAGTQSR